MTEFEGAGIALFAISYDPVEVLADFASKHGITYPLLSDEGSKVIRALGLYNEHLAEQAQFYGRDPRPEQYGVPYPGIFRLDGRGTVVDRQFEQSYRVRPAPALLLGPLSTGAPDGMAATARVEREGIVINASLDAATYRPYEQHELRVTMQMAPGLHVYGAPAPEGYMGLEVSVAPLEGLDLGPVELPIPRPSRIDGLDEEFLVYEDKINASLRFNIVPLQESATLSMEVRYQACTDSTCYPPDSATFELTVEGADLIRE